MGDIMTCPTPIFNYALAALLPEKAPLESPRGGGKALRPKGERCLVWVSRNVLGVRKRR